MAATQIFGTENRFKNAQLSSLKTHSHYDDAGGERRDLTGGEVVELSEEEATPNNCKGGGRVTAEQGRVGAHTRDLCTVSTSIVVRG